MPDAIERNLQYITDHLLAAWKAQNCLTCPLAELAALAQATLVFYQGQHQQSDEHWSAHWHRETDEWR